MLEWWLLVGVFLGGWYLAFRKWEVLGAFIYPFALLALLAFLGSAGVL